MLVAIQDVQALASHESGHLANCGLPSACLSHQEHRLHALQAPARKEDPEQTEALKVLLSPSKSTMSKFFERLRGIVC